MFFVTRRVYRPSAREHRELLDDLVVDDSQENHRDDDGGEQRMDDLTF